MPKLNLDHKSRTIQRILLLGDPGAGKTTCMGYLAAHGQKLFIADFDDGLEPVVKLIPPQFHSNIVYETLVDKVHPDPINGYPRTMGKPTAFRRFIKLLDRWVDSDGTDYGKPEEWPDNYWLVVDNLTALGRASLFYTQDLKNKMGQRVSLPLLGDAIARVEGIPQTLMAYPINTITLAHIAPVNMKKTEDDDADDNGLEKEDKMQVPAISNKLYPVCLGSGLPRRIGGYFTTVLQVESVGSGAAAHRIIRTVPSEDVDIKLPLPAKRLPPEVPITDLFRIIELIRKEGLDIHAAAA